MKIGDMPAFPFGVSPGLTIRQEFAGRAMQGILSDLRGTPLEGQTLESICKLAIKIADALIAELEKEPQK